MARQQGFTLIEVVVAITIASIVVAFAALFIAAPVNAYETEQQRAAVVDEAAAAWPSIQADLERALPNSLRATRNGAFVALELLRVDDYARYLAAPSGNFPVAGVLRGVPVGTDLPNRYLSVYNCGPDLPACPDAYTLSGSMTPAVTVHLDNGAAGEQQVTVNPAPVFVQDSPRKTVYLVSGPVTYLCDETQGTLRRYSNYPVVPNQASRDEPGDFTMPGVIVELMATGLTACDFRAADPKKLVPQTASLRLTATRASGERITVFHAAGSGWLP